MENISKKIIASAILAMFTLSNTMLTVGAMENAYSNKPALRDSAEHSIKLKGDVSFINSNETISLSLRDSDVKQVLRMFADKAGKNIIFHNSVEGTVTLDLVDVPLNSAFDMVLGISGLDYTVDDNTIIVAKAGEEGFNMAKQEMTLIPVKYVSAAAIAEFLNKNIFGMHKPGLSSSEIVSTNPATNELIIFGSPNDVSMAKKVVAKFDVKPTTTSFKVNHTTPKEMADAICKMLLPSTGADGGSTTGGAAGIMTGAADSMDVGGSSGGDSIALNGSSVACSVDSKANGSLGLQNLSVAYYPQQGTISILGGSEHQLEMIKSFIEDTDKKQPQAYLEVSVLELNEDGTKELQNTWSILSSSFSASFNGGRTSSDPLYPIFVKGDGYSIVDPNEYDSEKHQYKEIGRVGKWNGPVTITYAINYLIENKKARVVVNPRLMITNGVKTSFKVTEDYIKSASVDSSTSSGGTVTTVDYDTADDLGTTIDIMPFISPDGYVTLNVTSEYSTEKEKVTQNNPYVGNYVAATLLNHRNIDLHNLRIKDGETLVIAGMITERENKTVQKVPVLGDLPLIGALFRNTHSGKTKNEMLIMLTSKIITDSEDAVGNADAL